MPLLLLRSRLGLLVACNHLLVVWRDNNCCLLNMVATWMSSSLGMAMPRDFATSARVLMQFSPPSL